MGTALGDSRHRADIGSSRARPDGHLASLCGHCSHAVASDGGLAEGSVSSRWMTGSRVKLPGSADFDLKVVLGTAPACTQHQQVASGFRECPRPTLSVLAFSRTRQGPSAHTDAVRQSDNGPWRPINLHDHIGVPLGGIVDNHVLPLARADREAGNFTAGNAARHLGRILAGGDPDWCRRTARHGSGAGGPHRQDQQGDDSRKLQQARRAAQSPRIPTGVTPPPRACARSAGRLPRLPRALGWPGSP